MDDDPVRQTRIEAAADIAALVFTPLMAGWAFRSSTEYPDTIEFRNGFCGCTFRRAGVTQLHDLMSMITEHGGAHPKEES